jgi:serine/threonine protein kinase
LCLFFIGEPVVETAPGKTPSKPNDLIATAAFSGNADSEHSESSAAYTAPAKGETQGLTESGEPAQDRPASQETESISLGATEAFTEGQPGQPVPVKTASQPKSAAAKPPASQAMDATGEFVDAGARTQPEGPQTPAAKSTPKPAAPKAPEKEEMPQTIGDFRLEKKLGEGGMGAVYRAHQISMDRTVALKLLAEHRSGNQTLVDRFVREARTMARLDHPNIVRGYAVDCVDGQHLVVMEFVDGASMQKWMNKLGKLSVGDAVHVVLSTAYALQHAHENTLVHRDIKPDNILMTNQGVVKLADLGLVKASDENLSLTQSGTGFGTPFFMPLEQYRDAKRVDARADIYALGVTLYYFLTGKLPFNGNTLWYVVKAKEAAEFPPARRHNPEVPERLDLVIDKMIQKEAAQRYQTCAQVIEALESLGVASEFPSFIGVSTAARSKTGPSSTARADALPPKSKPSITPPAGTDDPGHEL